MAPCQKRVKFGWKSKCLFSVAKESDRNPTVCCVDDGAIVVSIRERTRIR